MRLRFLVEKLTELGLARLVWIDCRYRVGMPPPAAKSLGWAVGALQQSRRAWLPSIGDSLSPIGGLSGDIWVADPEGGPPGDPPPALTVVVGPEAGFIPEEVPEGRRVCWASSILRVETAAIVVAAWLETQRLTARNDHSPW
jgi:16S rRNA U1498 N3-methylase RsmE